jgi:hypothetical protein
MRDLLIVATLLTPLLIGLLFHGLCMKFGWLAQLTKPVDGGRSFRGQRLFGANKTYRGIVAVGLGTAIGFWLRAMLQVGMTSNLEAEWLSRPGGGPLLFGFTVGAAAMAAELPNSFVKRQLGIRPGAAGSGALGVVFYLLDQVDMLLGVWLVLVFAVAVTPALILWSLAFLFIIHQVLTVGGYVLGMRTTWR